MNQKLLSETLIVLSTMKGWPALVMPAEDEELGPVAMGYVSLLLRVPDDIGRKMRDGVLMRYNDRPDVKALGEWAASLAQSKPSAPEYLRLSAANADSDLLGGSGPDDYRQGHPQRPGGAGLAVLTEAARETRKHGGAIPQAMKDATRWLREREQTGPAPTVCREDAGDWGVEYVNPDGTSEKPPARYTEAVARAKAAEVRRQYPHLSVRVWCRGAAGTGMLAGGSKSVTPA